MSVGLRFCARVAAALAVWITCRPATAAAHPELEVVAGAVEEMLAAKPDDPELLLRQGRLREVAHDWDGALWSYTHAAEHGADPVGVAAGRGRVFLSAGFPRMALLEYDRALAQHPEAFEILFDRGRAYLALQRPAEAERDLARALARLPAPTAEHVMVRVDALRRRGEAAAAVRALDEGIARLGPLPALELPAIELEIATQQYDRALARLDRLLSQTPVNPAWVARRGEILQRAGRLREARAELARALAHIEAGHGKRRSPATEELAGRLRTELAALDGANGGER